jgi:hypothetical protein
MESNIFWDVACNFTDVSEEHTTSIFRVYEYGKQICDKQNKINGIWSSHDNVCEEYCHFGRDILTDVSEEPTDIFKM